MCYHNGLVRIKVRSSVIPTYVFKMSAVYVVGNFRCLFVKVPPLPLLSPKGH
jgi:hypothetical protein